LFFSNIFRTFVSNLKKLNNMNDYSEDQKEKVCDLVYSWMLAHGCYSGEMAMQDDDCQIYAIELVSDLADVVGDNITLINVKNQ